MSYNQNYPSAPSMPPIYQEKIIPKDDIFQDVCVALDIHSSYIEYMNKIMHYGNIIFLCDDSGSMNALNTDSNKRRYEELFENLEYAITLVKAIGSNCNISIEFLNNPRVYTNVESYESVKYDLLNQSFNGRTPLITSLEKIYSKYNSEVNNLIVVITDGSPTDSTHKSMFADTIKKIVSNKYFYISFLVCTDNDEDVEYLNNIDKDYDKVEVLDDYESEKKEVLKSQGKDYKYTKYTHIARTILSPMCPELNKLDEINLTKKSSSKKHSYCTLL